MTREDATIVASATPAPPATPGGTGAVSVVRLSGPDAFPIAVRLTGLSPSDAPPRTLRRCPARNAGGEILDTALAVFFPGPHSFPAEGGFDRGKMDLTQAEGLCDLIAARTEEAARSELRQMRGGIREEIVPLRERLLSLLVLQEAAIDFAEEDGVPAVTHGQIIERVSEISLRLEELLRSYEA